jgi:cation transport protein ChaC
LTGRGDVIITAVSQPIPNHRDPQALRQQFMVQWPGHGDLWVFGYASLIWRPEFEAAERRPALVGGWHRALRMRSRINRGTPEVPGLVFALLPGGSCRGMAYRIRAQKVEEELDRLWAREMPTGVYDPRMLTTRTPEGPVRALAFTLSRQSPACLPPLDDPKLVEILRQARGRFGTTLEYLAETAIALQACGIQDREINRLMGVARRAGLA